MAIMPRPPQVGVWLSEPSSVLPGMAKRSKCTWWQMPLPGREIGLGDGAPVIVGIRPEHADIGEAPLRAKVEATEILGSETIIHARLQSGEAFTLARRGISAARSGDDIAVALPAPFIHVFDEKGTTVGASEDWRSDYVR